MFNSSGDIARDARAFEDFLIEQGYAPTRARSIATKGFDAKGGGSDTEIAALVAEMKARTLRLETKGTLPFVFLRVTGAWSPPERTPAFTLSKPTTFKLLVARQSGTLAQNPFKGVLFLKFRYQSPTGPKEGTWQSNGNAMSNRFTAAAGTQEISVQGMTVGLDQVKVSFMFL